MSLLENMAKHVVIIKDTIVDDIIHFLDSCQCKIFEKRSALSPFAFTVVSFTVYGREVQTILESPPTAERHINSGRFTVTFEARIIKGLLLQIMRN